MFGRLNWYAFKHDFAQTGAVVMMGVVALIVIGLLFYYKRWTWLWKEWLTSVDPKKIGVMYLIVVLLSLFKGLSDAILMRLQQALAVGESQGYLSAEHFQEIFSAHGTTMVFFVGMGLVFAMMNLVVPLQIGARDVAFPFLNALSFWLYAAGALLVNISLAIGKFSIAGWLAYPPLSGIEFAPGEGVDYWIWIVQIAGVGSMLSGINFFMTIVKMRCHGMTFSRMPIFIWAIFGTTILIIFAFPVLTATLAMLALDRYLGMHFFSAGYGGNSMMYVNLIWAWGHPEVYILILPAFGIFSEVVPTFCEKKLFGYMTMVWALMVIVVLSFIVWLHHFFTMGASPKVNAFFGITTILIAVPTGVKIFNWLFTEYKGRVHFTTPMLWFFGFILNFTIGGMTGVLLSVPPIDYEVHNSLFLIAHFHGVLIGGMLFGFFSGYSYWFPKVFGFKLDEKTGRYAFWCWNIGFNAAFMPLYMLGFMGATRRLNHYEAATGWHPFFVAVAIGAGLILCGIGFQILQIIVSIRQRKENRDVTGDPWNGRTLEWSTPSPPPLYNFATIPVVNHRDAWWWLKKQNTQAKPVEKKYEDIHLPKNTPYPVIIGVLSIALGFALTWHIWWMSLISFLGILVSLVIRLSEDDTHFVIPASNVQKMETEYLNQKTYA